MEPMTDLFQSPVVVVDPDLARGRCHFTDEAGATLGLAVQVVGPQRAGGLAGWAASVATSGIGKERTVLRVDRPDGSPVLFVDRAEKLPGVPVAPAAIVAPDGQVIGRIQHRLIPPNVNAYGLLDPYGRLLCEATADPLEIFHRGGEEPGAHIRGGRNLVYRDGAGTELAVRELATHDRDRLTLRQRQPESLHTLIVASALAVPMMGLTGLPV
jgi:hypothetical protein